LVGKEEGQIVRLSEPAKKKAKWGGEEGAGPALFYWAVLRSLSLKVEEARWATANRGREKGKKELRPIYYLVLGRAKGSWGEERKDVNSLFLSPKAGGWQGERREGEVDLLRGEKGVFHLKGKGLLSHMNMP